MERVIAVAAAVFFLLAVGAVAIVGAGIVAKRDKATATALKRQGVKAGVPDLVLPVARCGYHGLYIELKAQGGSVQKSQKEFIKRLGQQGYLAVICYGWQDTVQLIGDYLDGQVSQDAAAGAGKEAGQEAASLLLPLA